jgi:hypothetical protein
MNIGTTIRALGARVRRLEDKAGKGRRNCIHCRLNVRRWLPDPKRAKPAPEDWMQVKCPYCDSEFKINLVDTPDRHRWAMRLAFTLRFEDYFTDPKAYAFLLWVYSVPELLKGLTGEDEEPAANERRRASKYEQLKAQLRALDKRIWQKLVAKYGEDPFPELTRVVTSIYEEAHEDHDVSAFTSEDYYDEAEYADLEQEEREYLVKAEMEKIIFGKVWPETEADIEDVRGRIEDLLGWPRQQKRMREEAEERRREEEEKGRLHEEKEVRGRAEHRAHPRAEREAAIEDPLLDIARDMGIDKAFFFR